VADWVDNSCGGRRWRTLPNGLIEVEGEGTPVYAPGSADFANLERTWTNWAPLFQSAARQYGIPVSWVVAMATSETGAWSNDPARQASIISFDQGVGIMQITKYPGTTVEQMLVPANNVATGAKILREKADRFGAELPYVAAGYNAGGVYCSPGANEWNFRATANYPRRALQYNNAALMYLRLGAATFASMLGWSVIGGIVAGVGWFGLQWWRRRQIR
jgi:hypothetical protein